MPQTQFLAAIGIATLAGLATAIGAALGVIGGRPGRKTLALSMGFSAGVMILISFGALLPEAQDIVGKTWGYAAFIGGMLLMYAIDAFIPHDYLAEKYAGADNSRAFKPGLLAAAGIAIHNFPEGAAVFCGALHDLRLGGALALAVALHNIPEGLVVSVPIYGATGKRLKSFLWGMFPGLAEPVGALIVGGLLYGFLGNAVGDAVIAASLAGAGGLMVYISLDELLPAACSEGEGHAAIVGVIIGIAAMAASLLRL